MLGERLSGFGTLSRMTVDQIKRKLESIIHGYEWACDHGMAPTENTAEIIIEQLNTLIKEIKNEN